MATYIVYFDEYVTDTPQAVLIKVYKDDLDSAIWIPISVIESLTKPGDGVPDSLGMMEVQKWFIDKNDLEEYVQDEGE